MTATPTLADASAAAEALAFLSVALIAACLFVGALALVLAAIENRRITLRVWLGLAWLATLLVPAVVTLLCGVVYAGAHALSRDLYHLSQEQVRAALIAIPTLALLLTVATIAWLTGRNVLKPLAAMSAAARQVAAGDLDIALPASQLREVREVSEAFSAMGDSLRTSIERQADLEQQRRLFVGAVAHDLRTPLFSLRGYLEGLEQGLADTPEKAARYLAVSRQQADALERLVADLFAYTRLEYLDETPRREPLDLALLLRTVAEFFEARAEAKAVTLAVEGACEPCTVEGDLHLLDRAFENLLDNALRHTPSGGRIAVTWVREGARCCVTVADSGPGFVPHDLPHVFDPLYRGDASRNRATGGAGLGLAIARRVLRAHAGDLTAANAPGGGAILTAYLPCAHSAVSRAPAIAQATVAPSA